MITIFIWPNGTWCEDEDIESYLQWMSDDYTPIDISEQEYIDLVEGKLDPQQFA